MVHPSVILWVDQYQETSQFGVGAYSQDLADACLHNVATRIMLKKKPPIIVSTDTEETG